MFSGYPYFDWEEPGIGRDITYMILEGTLTFSVLLLLEYRLIAVVIYKIKRLPSADVKPIEDSIIDSDVLEEIYRVKAMPKTEIESTSLVVQDMTKIYGKFLAVNQLSIAVDR